MQVKSKAKLKKEYPYDFWGIECGEGWKKIYEPLLEACEKEGIRVAQVKEKFGGLRFYVAGEAPEHIYSQIEEAERQSFKTCEKCGAPGTLRSDGWLSTKCDDCYSKPRKSA